MRNTRDTGSASSPLKSGVRFLSSLSNCRLTVALKRGDLLPALPNRSRTVAILDRLRDVLRSDLNTEIVATNAEPPIASGAPALTLPVISDLNAQIRIGDHQSYTPDLEAHSTQIRIGFARFEHRGFSSRGLIDIDAIYPIAVYVSSDLISPAAGDCVDDLIPQTLRGGLALTEAVRACIERSLPSTTYGGRVYTVSLDRDPNSPQNPDKPCKIYERFVLTIQIKTRARQSQGA